MSNITSARLFARLDFERENLDRTLDREFKAVRRSNSYSERVRWFQFSAAAALKIGVLYYALALWQRGAIGVGDFVMAVSLSLLIINEARNLSRRFLEFFEYIGNVANGVHTIIRTHELVDAPDAKPVTISRGGIEFRNVGFGYSNERRVFQQLDVHDPGRAERWPGRGCSGLGAKSTFVRLALTAILTRKRGGS